MSELANEEKLTLTQAAKLAPGRPHASSLWRHCRKGCKARSGERIHLEHVRFGGRVYTTAGAIERFSEKLARADAEYFADPEKPRTRPVHSNRERAIADAESICNEAGA